MTMIEDDRELLAAVGSDPDAFAAFYRRHVRGVLAYVARQVGPDDVGDLVAEVFAAALVHRRRFDPSRGGAEAWLTGIARHKIYDARRRGVVEAACASAWASSSRSSDGYTTGVTNLHRTVASIEAGDVGCPAMTP
jgi:DNA-directed RNA polymerase specialized sigma24 family protein